MKKTYLTAALLAMVALGIAAAVASGFAWADRDDDADEDEGAEATPSLLHGGMAPPNNALYKSECGACHLAYPPSLLPAEAWGRVMGSLGQHYGDDASLEAGPAREIAAYLEAHAADRSPGLRPGAFAAPLSADRAPRITQTHYFRRLHSEVSAQSVEANPKVRSFSACQACHQGAERGRFDDDEVRIPGAGG
jgi:hypothetical protein